MKFTHFVISLMVSLLIGLVASGSAMADVPAPMGNVDLVITTGDKPDSVYDQLYMQMAAVCKAPVMNNLNVSGSIQALDKLLGNRANLSFVQSDVVLGRKMIENDPAVDNVRVFMPLFNSELHIVTARTNQYINRFSDLGNKKIGAYGGAYITTRILLSNTGVRPFSVDSFTSKQELLNAVRAGTIDAAMIVEGQPAAWAQELQGSQFKLVPFDRTDVLAKVGSYSPSNLRYPNLSQTTVPSVSVQINLITYNYKSQEKVKNLAKLKACIASHIDDLRETTNNHPKWNEIQPNKKVTYWPMFTAGK